MGNLCCMTRCCESQKSSPSSCQSTEEWGDAIYHVGKHLAQDQGNASTPRCLHIDNLDTKDNAATSEDTALTCKRERAETCARERREGKTLHSTGNSPQEHASNVCLENSLDFKPATGRITSSVESLNLDQCDMCFHDQPKGIPHDTKIRDTSEDDQNVPRGPGTQWLFGYHYFPTSDSHPATTSPATTTGNTEGEGSLLQEWELPFTKFLSVNPNGVSVEAFGMKATLGTNLSVSVMGLNPLQAFSS